MAKPKKPKKALKITLIVLGSVLAVLVLLALINLKTIVMFFGGGKVSLKDYSTTVSLLKENDVYDITGESVSGDEKTLTCTSKDNLLTVKVTESPASKVVDATVNGEVARDIDLSNPLQLETTVKKYLQPFISDDQILGLTGYIGKEILGKVNNDEIHFSKTYDKTTVVVDATGISSINMKILQSLT